MRSRAVVLLAVVFALTGVAVGGDAKTELKKFEGTWSVASGTKNGKDARPEEVKDLRFSFSGNKVTVSFGEKSMEGSYKIDPSKKPQQIDMTLRDKTAEGIYKFKGDMLEICFSEPGNGRPTEFKAPEGTMTTLIVLKREKK